jgi:hypothetical protein
VFLDGQEFVGDFDWYEISVEEAVLLTWTVEAEFPVGAWIVDANADCAGATVLAAAGGVECTLVSPNVMVEPGTYWLVVGPPTADDLAQCGAQYVATAIQATLNPGDMDGDGDVELDDYAGFLDCVTGPAGGLELGCEPADADADCDADLADFAIFQTVFLQNQ